MELQPVVSGIIRHIITTSGGGVIGAALIAGNTIELLVGAAFALGGFVWSAFSKKKQ